MPRADKAYLPFNRKPRDKVLRPVCPNQGVRAAYHRALAKLLAEMHADVTALVKETYRENDPAVAADEELPASALSAAIHDLTEKWRRRFDGLATALAEHFARDVSERSDYALRRALKDAGITVSFSPTEAQRDILAATVHQNVGLIKSIPQKYLGDVEGAVMRSVQAGRDLSTLSAELTEHYGVSRRRAAFIARDQNNKASAALTRARQMELGIERAIWVHSTAGKEPRPTHVRMDGKKFDPAKGMYDSAEGRYVMPGELINCRCVSRPVVQGFS